MNLLWDPIASLSVARATGAAFVREVMTGVYESDLGMIEPRIGEIGGYREAIGASDVLLFDNIQPEFASAIGSRTVADRARGAAFLGVDAILISGPAAGTQFDMGPRGGQGGGAGRPAGHRQHRAFGPTAVVDIFRTADGAIVGTSLKRRRRDLERGRPGSGGGDRRSRGGGPRARTRPELERMAHRTKLYFATDLHGSSKCFRKFLNAGPAYGADVLILGADLAGKAIQGLVRAPGGRYRARFIGTDYDVDEGPDLEALEKLIEDHGYYPVRADPGELETRQADGSLDTALPRGDGDVAFGRGSRWLTNAFDPAASRSTSMLGNDDPAALRPILEETGWATHAEGRVLQIDDDHELVSWGYSNITPFHSHREQTEPELEAAIRTMTSQLHEPGRAIFNLHVPPLGSGLDEAPVLDDSLTVQQSLGQVRFAPVGSTAVRDLELEIQPLLGLHGHIHESAGIRRLGRTIAMNPGSDYGTGALNGALVTLEADRVVSHQLVRG